MPSVDIVARLKLAGEQFSSEFSQRMGRIESEARSTSARVSTSFRRIGEITIGNLGADTIRATASSLFEAAKGALDYASGLGETAQQLGVTTKDLQVYRYAASQVGVEQEAMDKSLAKLTLTIGKAAGGAKVPAAAFRALGVDIRDAEGGLRSAGSVLPDLADSLSKIQDPAKRAAYEVQLFGKTGQQLDTLLAGGRGQIDELSNAAERLGLVLSDEQIQNADDTADKLAAVKQILEARIASVVTDNADAILVLANALATAAVNAADATTAVRNFFALRSFDGGSAAAGVALAGSKSGRDALLNNINGKIEQNQKDRAANRGQRVSYLGGLIETTRGATPKDKARLDREFQALVRQRNAVLRIDRAATASTSPPPRVIGSDIEGGGSGGSKSRSKASGKSDAQREAEQRAKDGERLSKSLDEQIAKADDLARLDRTRLQYGDREADAQEAVSRVREQNRDIVEKTIPQLRAAYGWTEEQARAEKDRVRSLEDAAELTSKGATDARAAAESARERQRVDEEAQAAVQEMQEEARRRQEDQIRDLAGIYRDAFDGGSGSIWKRFKDMGLDAISELGARYTLALLSGKSTDFGSIVSGAQGSGSAIGSLLGAAGSLGSLFKGGSSAVGGISNVGQTLGVAQTGVSGAAAAGGLASAGSTLAAAAPYLAAAAVALPIVTGLLKKTKKGSATIGFTGDELGVTSLNGNSAKFRAASNDAAGSVIAGLQNIADELGGVLGGSPSVSIGVRHGDYRVDTTGQGITKKKKGAIDFDGDQEAAIKYAIADALKDGVLTGVSEAQKRLLASGGDIDVQLQKAVTLGSIPKLLKARLDPVGAAIDGVNEKFAAMVKIMDEAGASAEDRAAAERLYRLELDDARASAGGAAESLKAFLEGLKVGGDSPFSLRDQEAAAKAALDPFLAQINAGVSIDQQKYLEAAQDFLDTQRELYGSTQQYFDALASIQAATGKAVSAIENAVPISSASPADPFARATATAAADTAQAVRTGNEIATETNDLIRRLLAAAEANGGIVDVTGFVGAARGFTARAAS